MGELLATGSVLAAFFAGGVALFAPCCIVFLAPSYLAVAVRNRRWRILPLTFVFAAGLALVLVPITLGVSLVAGAVARYHFGLYVAGGVFMLALAGFSLSGRMMRLPGWLRAPDTSRGETGSFFALGVFSGIASSCCAPVLAGVMTLSALSGSVAGGVALGLAYTFGMVFPLFVLALVWDRYSLGERRILRARLVRLRLGRRTLVTNTVNLGVAVAFAVMGVLVLRLAFTGSMTRGPEFMTTIGKGLGVVFAWVQHAASSVPEVVLGLAVLAMAAVFVLATLRPRTRRHARVEEDDVDGDGCCGHQEPKQDTSSTPQATGIVQGDT